MNRKRSLKRQKRLKVKMRQKAVKRAMRSHRWNRKLSKTYTRIEINKITQRIP